ncbi:S-layer protein [Natronococcus pandeyae]|uniref:S-layer protein n=1 Tax=Natronococcus pandeyae TaxID=2055836 RepID=UPI0016531432|nr:S-layer protein [Natronococcus pandeyae]
MRTNRLTRRQVSVTLATGLGIALAGCAGDDGDDADENGENGENDDDEEEELDEEDLEGEDDGPGSLTVHLENEDGDPISEGVEVTVDLDDDPMSYTYSQEIEDGEVTVSLEDEGDYTVVAESTEDEFESVEEDVSVGEDDEEVTLTLEGATDEEEDEDGEDDEDDE